MPLGAGAPTLADPAPQSPLLGHFLLGAEHFETATWAADVEAPFSAALRGTASPSGCGRVPTVKTLCVALRHPGNALEVRRLLGQLRRLGASLELAPPEREKPSSEGPSYIQPLPAVNFS